MFFPSSALAHNGTVTQTLPSSLMACPNVSSPPPTLSERHHWEVPHCAFQFSRFLRSTGHSSEASMRQTMSCTPTSRECCTKWARSCAWTGKQDCRATVTAHLLLRDLLQHGREGSTALLSALSAHLSLGLLRYDRLESSQSADLLHSVPREMCPAWGLAVVSGLQDLIST